MLGEFGFNKTIIDRGNKVNIDSPNKVNFSYMWNVKVKCDNYRKGFKNKQGYGRHKLTCRKNDTGSNLAKRNEAYFQNWKCRTHC